MEEKEKRKGSRMTEVLEHNVRNDSLSEGTLTREAGGKERCFRAGEACRFIVLA